MGNENKVGVMVNCTYNYSRFGFHLIDESLDEAKVQRIKDSINQHGFLFQPVLVNEKMEIIDGLHRLMACVELGLPIYYVKQPGLGYEHRMAISTFNEDKDMLSEIGIVERKQSYKDLLERYEAYLPKQIICMVCSESTINCPGWEEKVQRDEIECDAESYCRADRILDWLTNFQPAISRVGGKSIYWYRALYFCYQCEEVDNKWLVSQFIKYNDRLSRILTIMDAVEQLEDIYNYGVQKKNKIFFLHSYKLSH